MTLRTLLFFLAAVSLAAQDYLVKTYTEDDGLPSKTIFDVAQAPDGSIWICTRQGIARYNGRTWKNYDATDGLAGMYWQDLAIDSKGRVWSTTSFFSGRVAWWNGERWNNIEEGFSNLGADNLTTRLAILEKGDQQMIGIITKWGLSIRNYQSNENGDLIPLEDHWQKIGDFDENAIYGITAHQDAIWLATQKGVICYDGKNLYPAFRLPEGRQKVMAVRPEIFDGRERVWIQGADWFGLEEKGQIRFLYEHPEPFDTPMTFIPDGAGGSLVTGPTLIIHITPDLKVRQQQENNNLLEARAYSGFMDRERNIWMAGSFGLKKLMPMRFANYNSRHGMMLSEITAIVEKYGYYFLGHNLGYTVWDGGSVTRQVRLTKRPVDMGFRVMDMHAGRDAVLMALPDYGIISVDGSLEYERIVADPQLNFFSVREDKDGNLWMGTAQGLFRQRDVSEGPVRMYGDDMVRRIHIAEDGTLYAAIPGDGVVTYDGEWRKYSAREESNNNVFFVFRDSRDRVLVGSVNEALILREDGLELFRPNGQSIDGPVYTMIEDEKGRIWFGTDQGVTRWDGNRLRRYTKAEGFAGMETNRAAVLSDSRGRLMIGSDLGLSIYQEMYDFPPESIPTPKIHIHPVQSDLQTLETEHIELASHDNDLGFSFDIYSFIDEKANSYQVRLDGYDRGWMDEEPSGVNHIRYTNLPPGDYQFRVKARSITGVWSDVAAGAHIKILEPFWTRIWFLALAGLVLSVFIYYVFDYLSYKRHSRYLEAQVRVRTLELEKKIEEQAFAEAEIHALNEDLEERVQERTQTLKSMQKELVETAHHAGMAEIATSIIHNVGNILNSISTSGYLIQQTIDKSAANAFYRANHLLRANMSDIEKFLLKDPRGMDLLKYYLSLEDKLKKEQESMGSHVNLLLDKIATIKDVVAQQHNYASGVFQMEAVQLSVMVDTALKILEGSLENRNIKVETHYHNAPDIQVRKTRLVHTLVNLIKNASESIISSGRRERRINISIKLEEYLVCLRLEDTGHGISPENLEKIFCHGFTTKDDGQGFGLHSCANAMQEMGGSIKAESDGVGKGASFLLFFPVG